LLPPATRLLLVERYIRETPIAEVAARMGLSSGAVEMRLQRGKLALRQVLANDLGAEAAAYGLVGAESNNWQETRIWCPVCGEHRLVGRFKPGQGELVLRCPGCCQGPDDAIWQADCPGLFEGVKGYKAAVSRQMKYSHDYFGQGLSNHAVVCARCNYPVPVQPEMLTDVLPAMRGSLGLRVKCARCGSTSSITHRGLVRCLPEVRRFWQEHPRIASLPEREIEAAGRPAIVTGFRSVRDGEQMDVVSLRDSFEVISISGT
jgi:Sigma-70, region 4